MNNILLFSHHFDGKSMKNEFISHFDVFEKKLNANWEVRFYRQISTDTNTMIRFYNFSVSRRCSVEVEHLIQAELVWVYKDHLEITNKELPFDKSTTSANVSDRKSQDGLLCIIFKGYISILKEEEERSMTNPRSDVSPPNIEIQTMQTKLYDDFRLLFEKEKFSDITFKCNDGEIRAHKAILCARSPVFLVMFETPMKESEMDVVEITDLDLTILKAMLVYMYCGQVRDLTVADACALMYAAEKYELPRLKQICSNFLDSAVSADNVLKILVTADLYDNNLKSTAINFICNNFSLLEHTEQWTSLKIKKPILAFDVYAFVVKTLQAKS